MKQPQQSSRPSIPKPPPLAAKSPIKKSMHTRVPSKATTASLQTPKVKEPVTPKSGFELTKRVPFKGRTTALTDATSKNAQRKLNVNLYTKDLRVSKIL